MSVLSCAIAPDVKVQVTEAPAAQALATLPSAPRVTVKVVPLTPVTKQYSKLLGTVPRVMRKFPVAGKALGAEPTLATWSVVAPEVISAANVELAPFANCSAIKTS
jgi:hypothetical protein